MNYQLLMHSKIIIMETFEEKLLKSFKNSLENDQLDQRITDFLIKKIAQEAVEYDMYRATDLKSRAKVITNSLIAKGEEIKL